MENVLKFLKRTRKRKGHEDVTWINSVKMPYYNPTMISLYSYGQSLFKVGYKGKAFPMEYWGIEFIIEGELTIVKDETIIHLNKGDILILYPNMTYQRINSGKNPVKKKEIMLNNSPIISILCNRSDLNGREVIKCSNPTAVEEYFNLIEKFVSNNSDNENLDKKIPNTIFALFTEIIAQCEGKSIYNSFDEQLKKLNVFSPNLTLEKIAKHFNVGTRTLNRMFNKHLHCTPFQYLTSTRMKYAAQLLSCNTLPIKDVAEECGYKNISFFISEFKKCFNKTPLEFRNSYKTLDTRKLNKLDVWNKKLK